MDENLEIEVMEVAEVEPPKATNTWRSFFKAYYGGWSSELISVLHGHFELERDYPEIGEVISAEFDHWYQVHLIKGLIAYSKSVRSKVVSKYTKPTKEIQSIVAVLSESFEEPDSIIWHDIYLILSDECRNSSIANFL